MCALAGQLVLFNSIHLTIVFSLDILSNKINDSFEYNFVLGTRYYFIQVNCIVNVVCMGCVCIFIYDISYLVLYY